MSAESDLLPGVAERLAVKFAELGKRLRVDACDYLLRDLTDATNAVAQLRASLLREPQYV
jgi:hypothetical protein